MFIETLFTIAKTWKQSPCPSIDDRIKKIWCIYIYIYSITDSIDMNLRKLQEIMEDRGA